MKIIICTLLLAFTTQIFARGGGPKDFKILDELNLSSDQVTKIEQFKAEHKKKKQEKRDVKREHREKMKQLFVDGAPDSEFIKFHQSIKDHRSNHDDKKLEKMIFLKNVLTKEQRTIYIAKKKEEKKECRKRGNRKD